MELLVVVLCVLLTAADGSGSGEIKAEVGSDVVLPCSLKPKKDLKFERFDWKKAEKNVFKYDAGITYGIGSKDQDEQFRDRVSFFPEELKNSNASIQIKGTRLSDSGNYTCDFPNLHPPQTFNVQLFVVESASKPTVKTVEESNSQAVLQCEVNGAFPKPVLQWKDSSGNIVPAEELQVKKREGKYDVILQTTVTKSDRYTCVVTQKEINHKTEAWTFVHISGSPVGVIIGSLFGGILLGAVAVGVGGYFYYHSRRSTQRTENTENSGKGESGIPLKPE